MLVNIMHVRVCLMYRVVLFKLQTLRNSVEFYINVFIILAHTAK